MEETNESEDDDQSSYKGLIIWEKLSRLAGAGYLPRCCCYGHTIVKLGLLELPEVAQ